MFILFYRQLLGQPFYLVGKLGYLNREVKIDEDNEHQAEEEDSIDGEFDAEKPGNYPERLLPEREPV